MSSAVDFSSLLAAEALCADLSLDLRGWGGSCRDICGFFKVFVQLRSQRAAQDQMLCWCNAASSATPLCCDTRLVLQVRSSPQYPDIALPGAGVVPYSAVHLQLQGNGKDLLKNMCPIQSQHEPVASLPSCLCPGDGKGADPRRAAASCPGGTAGGSLSIPCIARRALEELGLGCAQGPPGRCK